MEKAEDLICVRNILNLIVIELGRPSSWGNGWRLRRLVNVVQNFYLERGALPWAKARVKTRILRESRRCQKPILQVVSVYIYWGS